MPLFHKLKTDVEEWRNTGYACPGYPLIGEILAFQSERIDGILVPKYLREPQLLALEVYWYIRLIHQTPHIIDLYKKYFGHDTRVFFQELGISISEDMLYIADIEQILTLLKENEDFVKRMKAHTVSEAVQLDYPSYILALAMGAGKTLLIGLLIATEFVMAMRYTKGPIKFMKNALVFAPGTTILESLRQLSDIRYEKFLPKELAREIQTNLKIEFPGKSKTIQAQPGSEFNLIVTNTEKISLRAKNRQNDSSILKDRQVILANLRLQRIASLPNIGVFSDEAHHTYGNSIVRIKRVRETINYIHNINPLVGVVNTTGTPYHKRKILVEVIVWYGLGEGIKDNILKDLNNGIHRYEIGVKDEGTVIEDIISVFFETYGNVKLSNKAPAKIAFYFKNQDHLEECRLIIEKALVRRNRDPNLILVNTQQSSNEEIAEFRRLNDPVNTKRIILLVAKGVEGWDCPSLFASALIKEQTNSTYVLQAATRCLRQVQGNVHSAKIFLDSKNANILESQLKDNFQTDLSELGKAIPEKYDIKLSIKKTELPKLYINQTVKRLQKSNRQLDTIRLSIPEPQEISEIMRTTFSLDIDKLEAFVYTGESKEINQTETELDYYRVAWKLSTRYHLPVRLILEELKRVYPRGFIPESELPGLFKQIEEQTANYEINEIEIMNVMALINLEDSNGKELFVKEDDEWVHHLRISKSHFERILENDLRVSNSVVLDEADISFHYTPYNFDSKPEKSFFQKLLSTINMDPRDIEAFLFTGGISDPQKTDFYFEYLDIDNRYRFYFPDFVIVKRDGTYLIVEIKSEHMKFDRTVKAKEKSIRRIMKYNSRIFNYQVIYTSISEITTDDIKGVVDWIKDLK